MISHFLQRQFAKPISFAVQTFARHRSPGIYKELYLSTLFSYYFERRPHECLCPALPSWKASDNSDSDDDDAQDKFNTRNQNEETEQGVNEAITHSDIIGEEIPEDYVNVIQETILSFLGVDPNNRRFPGSQPVSLAQANIQLLEERAYRVTWKADGTRYMLFILTVSTYHFYESSHHCLSLMTSSDWPGWMLSYRPQVQYSTSTDEIPSEANTDACWASI